MNDHTNTKTYSIGGKTFYQERFTYMQRRWILAQLKGLQINFSDPLSIIADLGDRLSACYAAILIPTGETREEFLKRMQAKKEYDAAINHLEMHLEDSQEREVWHDFLYVNQIGSSFSQWADLFGTITTASSEIPNECSTNSVPSLAEETPPIESASLA